MLNRTEHGINTRDCHVIQTHFPMLDLLITLDAVQVKNRYGFHLKLNDLAHGHHNEVSLHPDHPS